MTPNPLPTMTDAEIERELDLSELLLRFADNEQYVSVGKAHVVEGYFAALTGKYDSGPKTTTYGDTPEQAIRELAKRLTPNAASRQE